MKISNQLNTSLIDIELAKVRSFIKLDRLDEAKLIIEELYKNSPNDNMVILVYAEYFIKSKDYFQALRLLNESLRINNNNVFTLSLIAEVYFYQQDYSNCISTSLIVEKLMTPSPSHEYLNIIYFIGMSYYKMEMFREAKIYLFYAQRLNHLFKNLFEVTSELNVVDQLLKSYENKKNDHWFLLACFKTFRRLGHKKHAMQFMEELENQFSFALNYDSVKLELEICKMIDDQASQQEFYNLQQKWIQKNIYAGCLFLFHELGIPKRSFIHTIAK